MPIAVKVPIKFEAICEYWIFTDDTEKAKQVAMKKIYNGEIGQYMNVIEAIAGETSIDNIPSFADQAIHLEEDTSYANSL